MFHHVALDEEGGIDLVTTIKSARFYRRRKTLDDIADYLPPTYSEFIKQFESSRWVNDFTAPVMLSTLENGKIVRGLAGIPSEGPVLLVGYHMLLGLELVPLIAQFLFERNIHVRGIAHPMMFAKYKEGRSGPSPSYYDTFRIMGAVPVSGTNLFKLLSRKAHILLYPGGMREALHRKGEEYKLFWPEQSEFVRMAARFGAKIVPFGAVGEDDIGQLTFTVVCALLSYRYFSATEMAPKGDGIVEWTDELESAFVDIMVDIFQRTHTSSWKMKDWEQISKELEEKFPGVILGADKVKTKAQRMKTQYTQFTELIQHTGVGWDAPTNTVKANPDIWDKFIKRHNNFRTFRSKGCKHYEALQLIYKTSSATGGLRISERDQLLPSKAEASRLYRALPGCEIRKYEENGHFLFLEGGIDLVTTIKSARFYRRRKTLDDIADYLPPTYSEFIKQFESSSNFRTFRSKGCKHYEALKLIYKTSSATGGLRISSTDPPHSPRSYERIEEEFLALRNSRGKEAIDLAEGSGDSDDPIDEAEEPVVTGSRRRVRKRGSNNKSQLQELIDLYKESKVKKDKAKNSTPPESKKSKSVTSPEKPAQNSIGEAMVILNQMRGTISVREYLAGTSRITEDERWRQAFVWMYDEARREWLHNLVHP
ncbi:hypothetical protein CDL15_Pgr006044 [Punica granatum]|uniref:Myb/SANT-like domain-containing protein n=1 Tax=Punica granatum TaxID=22663 RepID=A0A218VV56_PUNGR|nr:hypothetical protein CDL15_Pgr006044 [Punica granatum]